MPFYCYLLECRDGSYYCGWTTDLNKRLKDHSEGRGSKYTRSRLPVSLVYYEEVKNRSEALQREYELKKKNHQTKKNLVRFFNETAKK